MTAPEVASVTVQVAVLPVATSEPAAMPLTATTGSVWSTSTAGEEVAVASLPALSVAVPSRV